MPWSEGTVEDARTRFVAEVERSFFSFSELCRRHGISRRTGYKWWSRYQAGGFEALKDQPRRPEGCPHRTPEWMLEAALAWKRKHKRWGSKKIRKLLLEAHGWSPARSTLDALFKREGLVQPSRKRRRREHPGKPAFEANRPNAVWTADFKGEFKTGDGEFCYPLTIQDAYSRYLLEIRGLPKLTYEGTIVAFRRLFRQHGVPERIRTDNGFPFASSALGRISKLSIYFIQLGIRPETIEPGKPSQNGRHERMHRTLKARTARPPSSNLRAQQARFNAFRETYNELRPHEALGQETPASWWRPSERRMPRQLKPPCYPGHFEVRKVAGHGMIKWKDVSVFVSNTLAHCHVGLEEIDHGLWTVHFGPTFLGWFDEEDYRIMDVRGYRRSR